MLKDAFEDFKKAQQRFNTLVDHMTNQGIVLPTEEVVEAADILKNTRFVFFYLFNAPQGYMRRP